VDIATLGPFSIADRPGSFPYLVICVVRKERAPKGVWDRGSQKGSEEKRVGPGA